MKYILLLTFLLAHSALAETATLEWDANPEPDIAGYEISYGTDAGKLDVEVPVGKVTEHRLTDLVPGTKYFLTIRAKSESGGISSPSDTITTDTSGDDATFNLGFTTAWTKISTEYPN